MPIHIACQILVCVVTPYLSRSVVRTIKGAQVLRIFSVFKLVSRLCCITLPKNSAMLGPAIQQ